MACIRKRRNKWVIDFRDQTGKRRWETIGGSKRDAELLLAERLQQVNRHEYLAVSDEKTLAELADAYYSGHIAVNIRESTRKDYEVLLRRHLLPYLGRTRLRAITPQLVEAWRGKLLENGLGRRTTNKAHTLLGALMRYAIRQRWLAYNVAADVRKLREENRASAELLDDNVLSPEEVRALLEQADTRWRPLLMTAVSTGMRQGELLGLKWGDIDWQSGQLHVRRQFSKGRFADRLLLPFGTP